MADQDQDKSEKPSGKRIKDARKRGQIARSKDLASAFGLIAIMLALLSLGPGLTAQLGARVSTGLEQVGDHARTAITAGDITTQVVADAGLIARLVGPIALIGIVVSLVVSYAQGGWNVSAEALKLNWGRLNPSNGLAKLKPSQGGVDLLKALIGATVVGVIAYHQVTTMAAETPRVAAMAAQEAFVHGWDVIWSTVWKSAIAMALLAGGDYGLQYYRWYSSLKMTRQEVRDEGKASEGSPEIKARVRKVQREMAKRRMIAAVKEATVVVTNPTHYAVALKYQHATRTAPTVVAKGQDALAARIREAARKAGVPIVENVALARALHKDTEVGDSIPANLFAAVAEVLAYLVKIKQLML
ncbi:MAG TPA: EscU/YscU/HrcU family type III secretion system export apparatus switch protein [Vicinamibacterales bacterium]|nr:EscU/YscU/HrcU family type III secretion system export apparatus switch protein [Vicinamibacterales bacterium]